MKENSTSLPRRRPRLAEAYLLVNGVLAALFACGVVLDKQGFSPLLIVIGLVCFFLPALNLTYVIERFSNLRQGPIQLTIWTTILSLTITPALTWFFSLALRGNPIDFVLPGFITWWMVSLLLAVLFSSYGSRLLREDQSPHYKELLLIIVIFLAAIVGAAILYPFIPEADSYTYLIKLREVSQNPAILATDGRPLFLVLLNLFSRLTSLNPYWLLKIVLPLLTFNFILTIYLIAQNFIKERWLRLVSALSPLYFPVIFQEIFISRPQSIALLVLVPALYFYGHLAHDELLLDSSVQGQLL